MNIDNLENNEKKTSYKPFVKASERAEEYKSSAYSLLTVGGLGIIFLFLSLLGVIPLKVSENIRVVGFIAMLVMFTVFVIVGVKSLVEAKTISALSEDEDAMTDNITSYFSNNYTSESIDEIVFDEEDKYLTDEEKYFKREDKIKRIISEQFGELEESYLNNETERIYNNLYGN